MFAAQPPPPDGTRFLVTVAPVRSPDQREFRGPEMELTFQGGVARVEVKAGRYVLGNPLVRAPGGWVSGRGTGGDDAILNVPRDGECVVVVIPREAANWSKD